jgi:hypothetical protein
MMYKSINGKPWAYLIDFDLASLADGVAHNLDRTGTIPFMALGLLDSANPGRRAVEHIYEHDAEAVCWVLLWLGVQYEGGSRVSHAFSGWEMVDAATCFEEKTSFFFKLDLEPFTGPNERLQEPVRDILQKVSTYYSKRVRGKEKLPPPCIHKWLEKADKEIRS